MNTPKDNSQTAQNSKRKKSQGAPSTTAEATGEARAKHVDTPPPLEVDPREWVHEHPVSAVLAAAAGGFAAGSGLGRYAVVLMQKAVRSEQGKRIAAAVYPLARAAAVNFLKDEVLSVLPRRGSETPADPADA